MIRTLRSMSESFQHYRFKSLLLRHFLQVFLSLTLPVFLLLLTVFLFFQKTVVEETRKANDRALGTASSVLGALYRDTVDPLINIAVDPRVGMFLRQSAPETYQDYQLVKAVRDILRLSKNSTFFHRLEIYSAAADYYVDDAGYATRGAYLAAPSLREAALNSAGRGIQWEVRTIADPPYGPGEKKVLSAVRSLDHQGWLAIHVNPVALENLLRGQELDADGMILLLDNQDKLLFHTANTPQALQAGHDIFRHERQEKPDRGAYPLTWQGQRYMVVYQQLSGTPWRCALMIPRETVEGSIRFLRSLVIASLTAGLLVSLCLSLLLSQQSFRPIKEIMGALKQLESEERSPQDNELSYILMHLASLYDGHRQLKQDALERYSALTQAQALALQAQLGPHFLNNTIQVIQWMVLSETGREDSPALEALATLARIAGSLMENRGNQVTLAEELQWIDWYTSLLNLRYGHKIRFLIHVPESLYRCSVLRMCLQPLVENAVEHTQKGWISIHGERISGCLVLTVSDTGRGMTADEMERYNQQFLVEQQVFIHHIGLGNLNQRLRLLYGPGYPLCLSATPGGGLTVTIRMPLKPLV